MVWPGFIDLFSNKSTLTVSRLVLMMATAAAVPGLSLFGASFQLTTVPVRLPLILKNAQRHWDELDKRWWQFFLLWAQALGVGPDLAFWAETVYTDNNRTVINRADEVNFMFMQIIVFSPRHG